MKGNIEQAYERIQQVWFKNQNDLCQLSETKAEVMDVDNLVIYTENLISIFNNLILPMKEMEQEIDNAQDEYSTSLVPAAVNLLVESFHYQEEKIRPNSADVSQSIEPISDKYQKIRQKVDINMQKCAKLIIGSIDAQKKKLDNYLEFLSRPRVKRGENKMTEQEWNARRNFILSYMRETEPKLLEIRKVLQNRDSEHRFSPMHRNFIVRYGLTHSFNALIRVLNSIKEKGFVEPD